VGRISDIISNLKDRLAGLNLACHVRTGSTIMAVIIAGYAAADTAVNLTRMEIPQRPEAGSAAPRSRASAAPAEPADYSIIAERNYFGSSSKPAAAGDWKYRADYGGGQGGSSLPLDLLGTVAGRNGRGYAIIEERDKKKQGLFKVGDTVAGATLREVRRNAVVLNVSGKDELLEVRSAPREPLAGAGPAAPAAAAPPQRPAERLPPGAPARAPAAQMDSPALKEVRDLLAEGQAKPHFNAGKMEGFYINKVKDGSYLQKAGFEDGDIVQSVNSRKIENANDVVWIQKAISNPADKVSLQVNRKGRVINLDVN
jgi:type II secretion system protein C